MNTALLIPIYQPSDKVLPFLKQFRKEDFTSFLVVDDGSGEEYADIFKAIEKETVFQVLSYMPNGGKGHALKTGMKKLTQEDKDLGVIVTADGDGQHTYPDILKVRDTALENPDTLIMGVRNFKDPSVPKRSRFGNNFSATYFRLSTGVKLNDTQTGLRAIPSCLFPLALETDGDRFEYEMKFLMAAVKETDMKQVQISTVYEDKKHHKSHFKTFKDSFLIYKTPILYLLVSLASWGIDEGLFAVFSNFVFTGDATYQIYLSTVVARVISGLFNFFMFTYLVFPNKGSTVKKAVRYLILFLINMALSASLTYAFNLAADNAINLTALKIIVDIVLAIVNYFINLTWTFANKKRKKAKKQKKEEMTYAQE